MIRSKIKQFLQKQCDEKIEKKRKELSKEQNHEKIINELKKQQQKYDPQNWIAEETIKMAEQLQFCTHHSKGIHSQSKGSNLRFDAQHPLPQPFIGSQYADPKLLDVTGNAAALPLANFLELIIDEEKQLRLRDLIEADSPELKTAFADDPELSKKYQEHFQKILKNQHQTPTIDHLNKQILWPENNSAQENDHYTILIPLHPSTLTHTLYQKIQQRYEAENKKAKDNRYAEKAPQKPYISCPDLAYNTLGGTKPQNVSSLNSRQKGKNYLLPSLPKKNIFKNDQFYLPKNAETLFTTQLAQYCQTYFKRLVQIAKNPKNNKEIRTQYLETLTEILHNITTIAATLQQQEAGWTKKYTKLAPAFKYWLDPKRAELEGEEEFKTQRTQTPWLESIQQQIAFWINAQLKYHLPNALKTSISEAEHKEWEKQIKRHFQTLKHN